MYLNVAVDLLGPDRVRSLSTVVTVTFTDFPAGPGGSSVQWTLRWTEPDSWLGYNVDVKVESD